MHTLRQVEHVEVETALCDRNTKAWCKKMKKTINIFLCDKSHALHIGFLGVKMIQRKIKKKYVEDWPLLCKISIGENVIH